MPSPVTTSVCLLLNSKQNLVTVRFLAVVLLFLVTVAPAVGQVTVVSVTTDKSEIISGGYGSSGEATATVTVNVSTGCTVQLSKSGSGQIVMPTTLTIPNGSSSASFLITSNSDFETRNVTLTASWTNGMTSSAASGSLTTLPIRVETVTLSPSAVFKNTQYTATATITHPHKNNQTIWFSSDNQGAAPIPLSSPRSVVIPAGQTSGSKTFTAGQPAWLMFANITGSFSNTSFGTPSAMLSVAPDYAAPAPGGGNGPDVDLACGSLSASINARTGNLFVRKTDPIWTRGYPIVNNIALNGQPVETNRPMGNATFTYDIHLTTENVWEPLTNGGSFVPHWMMVDGDGSRYDFGPAANAPAATAGIFSQLVSVGGGYELRNAGPPENIETAGNFTYAFDGSGRLTQLTDPRGNVQALSYTAGKLTGVLDVSTGKSVSYVWTGSRITQIVANGGQVATSLAYVGSNLTSISVAQGPNVASTVDFTYNANGSIASIVRDSDQYSRMDFTYREWLGRTGTVLLAQGAGPSAKNVTLVNYSASTSTGYASTRKVTNHRGGVTTYDFDTQGNVLRVTHPTLSGATQATVETFTYNANRQVTSVKTNGTTDFTVTYTANGLVDSVTRPAIGTWSTRYAGVNPLTATDPLLRAIAFAYGDPAQPNVPTTFTDPGSFVWQFFQNAFGQNLTTTPPAGSVTGPVQSVYDENALSPTRGYLMQVTDANGDRVTFDSYSPLGDLTQFSTYPVTGNPLVFNSVGLTYDAAQRLTSITFPDGKTTQLLYTGRNLGHTIDAAGRQYHYDYCSACDALETITGPLGWSLNWTYDNDRLMTAFTDARGKVTSYSFGSAGEATGVTYPDGSTIGMLYDARTRAPGDQRPRPCHRALL